ncbi:MAG TPA: Lrp/AsnC family transcriptional regulator [Chroococcales cyanobacterium]
MDEIDLKLLASLSQDAKQKYTDLALELNMSAPSVHARVKKLEQTGLIKGYSIEVDPKLLGLNVCAFVRVTTEGASCEDVCKHLRPLHEIEEAHSVAGEECLLLKVRTKDPGALSALLDRIRKVPGVRKTVTSVVLETRFERPTSALSLLNQKQNSENNKQLTRVQ